MDTKEISNIVKPVPPGTKRPLWSVMIPTFNPNEKFLIESINSVIIQDPGADKMQIEVVDDCSTKVDIKKIINENWKDRVLYHRLPKNVGHSFNFTESVRRAKGELVHLLHDDDKVKPGFYEKFEDIFNKYENIGAAFCRQEYIDDDDNFMFFSEPEMEETGILDDALIKLAQKQRIQYCAMVVRRNTYEKVGGYVPKNIGCEDWEMWVRIAAHFPVAYEPEAIAQYRIHRKSMTLTDMRTGQDMRFLREAADIFTQYLPEDKREEVSLFRRKHYSVYSFNNAKRMYEEFNDEEGAAAQLSETIILNSETVFENLEFLKKFKIPIKSTGVSVIVNCKDDEELIEITLRSLVNQRVPKYIPWEVIFVDNASNDNSVRTASETWSKYRSKTPFKVIQLIDTSVFEARKTAIESCEYNFIVFCNPGNLLNINYIESVSGKMLENMHAGAIGGITEHISRITLPEWFKDWSNYCYQIGEQFEYSGDITWAKGFLWSAGMAIRKEAWKTLTDRNFKSLFGDTGNKIATRGIDSEICLGLRSTGWKLIYTFDLRLKIFISEYAASWKYLRKIWKQLGVKSVVLSPYFKIQNKKIKDFNDIHVVGNQRILLKRTIYNLRKIKLWKLLSYTESLEGDPDILKTEYLFGSLGELLKEIKSYNKELRRLKKSSRKIELRYLKYIINNKYFRYPQYKVNKGRDKRGISVVLKYQNSSFELLRRSLEHISKQNIYKDYNWEVIVLSNFIKEEFINELKKLWMDSGCGAEIKFETQSILDKNKINLNAGNICSFEYIIFLNETDFICKDYLRIADKVLKNNKEAGIAGGQTELESSVKPPKWFEKNKELYSIGKIAERSEDITDRELHLWNSGIVIRKNALNDVLKLNENLSRQNISEINYELPYDPELESGIKLSGWKILYEQRLVLKHFVSVRKFNWNYLRKIYRLKGITEVKQSFYSRLIIENAIDTGIRSRIRDAGLTLSKINKYPVKKIFSEERELNGDTDVLEIERLKGNLKEIMSSKDNYVKTALENRAGLNGNRYNNRNGKSLRETDKLIAGVSIVICCYNSAGILPLTLKYIFRQVVPQNIPWEIIIVDNASTDNTSEIAKSSYESSNCLATFKIVKEPKPGLSEARQTGFDTARFEYVEFCDDDNLLNKDFVKLVFEIMQKNAEIGVLGGQSIADFDLPPAFWFKDWKNSFAIGKQSDTEGDITWTRGYVWGASMVVRKEAWKKLKSRGFKSLLTDRKGNTLSAGGDTEICYAVRNSGWKIWYDSRLKFKHHLPVERLDWIYLRKLFRGFGQASAGLDHYLKTTPKDFRVRNKKLIPGSARYEIKKTLKTLRSIRYKKLLTFHRKREGDTDIPMHEYCLGRIEGLLKTRGTYNRGINLLKKAARKKDFAYLSPVFINYNNNFPRYKTEKKLNGVSIIVCTYNGAERLSETIKHLALQKVDKNILWEVVFVDNASTDNSKEVTINEWKKHKCNANLIIVDQPLPGKQLALEKGYEFAKYEFLITCDDDNWLDENFVQLSYEIMSKNPKVGILGGPNEPLCEVEPPGWFTYFKRDYAAGPQGDIHTGKISLGDITWKRGYVWGAGMIVRKSAWEKLLADGFRTSMSCRKGSELSSGGDSEMCYALVLAGWKVWYDERLKLKHCMPAGRLDWNYLVRLFTGFGIASVGLEPYEKAIKLGRADVNDEEIKNQNWKYEYKKTLKDLRKYGLKKILSLRFPQENNTDILMLEFNLSRLKELRKVKKDYDKNFYSLINSPWKKDYKELKAEHIRYLQSENDFRYGWPWSEENVTLVTKSGEYPKISVLSPSFNSVGTIEKAILSVLKQGYPDFEHIICDGGSSDGTVEILKKYPHLKWISEPDKGQSDAMNKAFKMSTGEIITYLNVDDYYQRGAFLKIAKAFKEDPSAEMVVGNLLFDFEDHTYIRKPEIDYRKVMLPFLYMFPINPVSYFYKRKVQTDVGEFPLENHFTMDYWFLLRAYQNHKLTKIEDYLGTFCMNGYNKTSNADNRKNTHHRVLYHCWHYDKKNLPFYLYNYYKFFYYDKKPYNLSKLSHKFKKNISRIYSVLSLKKNKYYSQIYFEKSRYRYYENRRIRSLSNLFTSFLLYPKGLFQRSKQSQFVYSFLGKNYSEKAKLAYFFFTTPPGLPLGNKLHYYSNEFRNKKKSFKGYSLLFLTYLVSPKFISKDLKRNKSDYNASSKPVNFLRFINPFFWIRKFIDYFRYRRYDELSYLYFYKAGDKYYFHKNIQATFLMIISFIIYPLSVMKKERLNLFSYSAFGTKITDKLRFAYHLYKDNPELSFAHKINYYGNELRKEGSSGKGNLFLMISYILSPKYIKKREKIVRSNVVYVSNFIEEKRKSSINPYHWASGTLNNLRQLNYRKRNFGAYLRNSGEKLKYNLKKGYHYFRYRKYKAKSKMLYAQAIENYNSGKRMETVKALIPSYLLYPVSIFNRNKLSLMKNSILGSSKNKTKNTGGKN